MKEMRSPLAYPVLALQLVLAAAACGCAHVGKLPAHCKEVPECRPSSFLGYYSTQWMPIEYFGTVEMPYCHPSGSCSRCALAAAEGEATDVVNDDSVGDPLVIADTSPVSERLGKASAPQLLDQTVVPYQIDESLLPSYVTASSPGDHRTSIADYDADSFEVVPEDARGELESPMIEVSVLRIQEATRF
jgi:hypothetical protein